MDVEISSAGSGAAVCATLAAAIQDHVPGDHYDGPSLRSVEDANRASNISAKLFYDCQATRYDERVSQTIIKSSSMATSTSIRRN